MEGKDHLLREAILALPSSEAHACSSAVFFTSSPGPQVTLPLQLEAKTLEDKNRVTFAILHSFHLHGDGWYTKEQQEKLRFVFFCN